MKASHTLIRDILASLESGDGALFDKLASRYKGDGELQAVHKLHCEKAQAGEVKTRLQELEKARSIRSAGTELPLSDRRSMSSERKRPTGL